MDSISSISKSIAANQSVQATNDKVVDGVQPIIQAKAETTYSPDSALESPSLTVEEIDYAVEVINDTMTQINRSLNFGVDEDNGRTVIKIIDRDTDEVIKQIPSEDLLKLISHMQEMQSLLSGENV